MEPLSLRPVVEIAASNESTRALAKRFGVSELTIAKWRKRASVNDLSHTPHRLQTTLSPAQEAIVVELRKSLLLPLDDLVAVTKEFICPKASRSGLDRSLRRHGLSNLHKLKPIQPKSPHKPFKSYVPGYPSTWISNTCHRWPMRLRAAICWSP